MVQSQNNNISQAKINLCTTFITVPQHIHTVKLTAVAVTHLWWKYFFFFNQNVYKSCKALNYDVSCK